MERKLIKAMSYFHSGCVFKCMMSFIIALRQAQGDKDFDCLKTLCQAEKAEASSYI